MRLNRVVAVLATVAAVLSYSTPAFSAVKTWTLIGVTFDDGGTATGTFDFDADTQDTTNISISVSGGGTGVFPPFTYTRLLNLHNIGNPANTYRVGRPGQLLLDRCLRFTPIADLTNAGGTVALDLATADGGSGGVECYNCNPFRLIDGGSLTALEPVPTVSEWGLIVMVLLAFAIGTILYGRRRLVRS